MVTLYANPQRAPVPKCLGEVSDGWRVCPNCRTPLAGEAETRTVGGATKVVQRNQTWLLLVLALVVAVFLSWQLSRLKPAAPARLDVVATVDAKSKVVENSTERVTATMYVKKGLPKSFVEEIQKRGTAGSIDKSATLFIRAELSAPGLEIGDKATQDKALDRMAIPFTWDCRFKEPGAYEVKVVFSTVDAHGTVWETGEVTKRVQVTSPGGFTQTWLWVAGVFAALVALIGGILTIIGFFKKTEPVVPAHTPPLEAPVQLPIQPINGAPTPPVEVNVKASSEGNGDSGENY